jgi:hypothetical protein
MAYPAGWASGVATTGKLAPLAEADSPWAFGLPRCAILAEASACRLEISAGFFTIRLRLPAIDRHKDHRF